MRRNQFRQVRGLQGGKTGLDRLLQLEIRLHAGRELLEGGRVGGLILGRRDTLARKDRGADDAQGEGHQR